MLYVFIILNSKSVMRSLVQYLLKSRGFELLQEESGCLQEVTATFDKDSSSASLVSYLEMPS